MTQRGTTELRPEDAETSSGRRQTAALITADILSGGALPWFPGSSSCSLIGCIPAAFWEFHQLVLSILRLIKAEQEADNAAVAVATTIWPPHATKTAQRRRPLNSRFDARYHQTGILGNERWVGGKGEPAGSPTPHPPRLPQDSPPGWSNETRQR